MFLFFLPADLKKLRISAARNSASVVSIIEFAGESIIKMFPEWHRVNRGGSPRSSARLQERTVMKLESIRGRKSVSAPRGVWKN